ncbi:MAG: recombinase family protein [Oscillospiraceae bacterium]|jgi:DNA invertase Pin-like site-specific DNA recombinase|nr:recombinase family protein [Oscillospiraceae bacterium]
MAKTVTIIPAFTKNHYANIFIAQKKKRVAGYARVSTDQEEQLTSYEAQVDYYSRYIKSKEDWEYVNVYTDEGITATNTKKRDGFNKMINDALGGKIDLIVTKSVSRFARNTVDSLTTVRKLKEKGIEVYFEKENIYTLDSKGELLLTIMSSLAQEESRSISENVTWGKRKKMADGNVEIRYKLTLGYEKGEDGKPKIVEHEAKTVRLIFSLFLEGKSYGGIAKYLEEKGFKTAGGKSKWSSERVKSILKNEKYVGNATLQKTFTVDFLTKKTKRNEGEVPQYHVENSHPAIVSTEIFDLAQNEINRRRKGAQPYCTSIFSGKIFCGECGTAFGSKVWNSTSKYRRVIWRCNKKYAEEKGGKQGGKQCNSQHVTEEQIKLAFVMAINQLGKEREKHIACFEETLPIITDTKSVEKEIEKLTAETEIIEGLIHKCINDNATNAQDQNIFKEKYESLITRMELTQKKLEGAKREKQEKTVKKIKILSFFDSLKKIKDSVTEFSEPLWLAMAEFVTVQTSTKFKIKFRGEIEIEVDINNTEYG